MNLWLISFRGAGKSTLGKRLASELGWRFLDLDQDLETRLGCTIGELVDREGEEAFRAREEELLREVASLQAEGLVIATGGGFVERDASREIVATSSWPKAWLDVPAEALWARLKDAPERRKIGHLTDYLALQNLLEKRRPFYAKIATFRVESQDISERLALLKSAVQKP